MGAARSVYMNLLVLPFYIWIPDENEIAVLFSSDAVERVKESEIQSWIENGVFEEVEDKGQFVMVTENLKEGKTIRKARLVTKGFEEYT